MKLITLLMALSLSLYLKAEVLINQVGFAPEANKVAIVTDQNTGPKQFSLTDSAGVTLFSGRMSPATIWQPSGQHAVVADFSKLRKAGKYRLLIDGQADVEVTIAQSPYLDVLKAANKAYYFNRASIALETQYAGQWSRAAGHADNKVMIHSSAASPDRPSGTILSSPKGWYDAGDYNKYVVNSAITLYTLLDALQQFPDLFNSLTWNIPESEDSLPDLLNEISWNLDWLLSMQDPNDGGVYHKLTTLKFSGHVMPDKANEQRYLVQKSTGATLDFAAVTAFASRALAKYQGYEERSTVLLNAAIAAWSWAKSNPHRGYVQPSDVGTGTYISPGEDFADEGFWAATELAISTGDLHYLSELKLNEFEAIVPSWEHVGALAWISLSQTQVPEFKAISMQAQRKLKETADKMLSTFSRSSFVTSMGTFEVQNNSTGDFIWGSNGVLANHNLVLFHAYRDDIEKVIPTVQGNVDYLLGKNATGYSFVTGFGWKTPLQIHHRPSWADSIAKPVPGFLVGGPHSGQQDSCAGYPAKLAPLSYVDDTCSYSTNEVAINWNAPLVFSLALLQQVYQ